MHYYRSRLVLLVVLFSLQGCFDSNCFFRTRIIEELCTALETNTEHELIRNGGISYSSTQLTQDELNKLSEALRKNTTVQELHIYGQKRRDALAQAIAGALEENTTLNDINISYNNVGHVGAQAITKALETNKTVQNLNLNGNSIADAGAQSFCKAIENNKTLQNLRLNNNSIGDTGAQAIVEALKKNTDSAFQKIELWDNQITSTGSSKISNMLAKTAFDWDVQNHIITRKKQ